MVLIGLQIHWTCSDDVVYSVLYFVFITLKCLFQARKVNGHVGVSICIYWCQFRYWHQYIHIDTPTWPFTFLAWNRHFNLKKCGLIKLVLSTKPKASAPIHRLENSVATKNVVILKIAHTTSNINDTEPATCIILVPPKWVYGISHHLNIR